jgi:hypothetical protein
MMCTSEIQKAAIESKNQEMVECRQKRLQDESDRGSGDSFLCCCDTPLALEPRCLYQMVRSLGIYGISLWSIHLRKSRTLRPIPILGIHCWSSSGSSRWLLDHIDSCSRVAISLVRSDVSGMANLLAAERLALRSMNNRYVSN